MISEKLFDGVYYYKNVISDPKKLVDLIESTQEGKFSDFVTGWEEWSACSGEMYIYGEHKRIKCLSMEQILKDCKEDILEDAKYIYSEIFDGMKRERAVS